MRTQFGWRPEIIERGSVAHGVGLGAFAQADATAYGTDSNNPTQTASSDTSSQILENAGNFLDSLWKNVGQTVVTTEIQKVAYGDPTGYYQTADGKRIPYWGQPHTQQGLFTIDPTGNKVTIPNSSSTPNWLLPAAIGGGALILALVMMRR